MVLPVCRRWSLIETYLGLFTVVQCTIVVVHRTINQSEGCGQFDGTVSEMDNVVLYAAN